MPHVQAPPLSSKLKIPAERTSEVTALNTAFETTGNDRLVPNALFLNFVERHGIFIQLIPFILAVVVLLLSSLNQDAAGLQLSNIPDLR